MTMKFKIEAVDGKTPPEKPKTPKSVFPPSIPKMPRREFKRTEKIRIFDETCFLEHISDPDLMDGVESVFLSDYSTSGDEEYYLIFEYQDLVEREDWASVKATHDRNMLTHEFRMKQYEQAKIANDAEWAEYRVVLAEYEKRLAEYEKNIKLCALKALQEEFGDE